jgi:probable rRNA maturation factor
MQPIYRLQVHLAIAILCCVVRSRAKMPVVSIVSRSKAMRVPRKRIAGIVAFVARSERAVIGEVDVAVVDSPEMAALNRRYAGHRGITDVLSFDLSSAGEPLSAQIIVCGEVAVKQARELRVGPQRELLLYVVHGLLHFLGYSDTTPRKAERMARRQEELLSLFLEIPSAK